MKTNNFPVAFFDKPFFILCVYFILLTTIVSDVFAKNASFTSTSHYTVSSGMWTIHFDTVVIVHKNGRIQAKVVNIKKSNPPAWANISIDTRVQTPNHKMCSSDCVNIPFDISFQGLSNHFSEDLETGKVIWGPPEPPEVKKTWHENILYCPDHLPSHFTIEPTQHYEQNNYQNNGHDPCDISSRISREQVSNKTFLNFRKGRVLLKPVGCGHWVKAKTKMNLKLGDEIKTGPNGRATIVLGGVSFIRVKPNSKLIIPKNENTVKKISFLKLLKGVLWTHAKKEENSLKIATPSCVVGVRGTEFEVSYLNDVSCVKALKHSVWFSDLKKSKTVIVHEGGKSCIGEDGLPLEPTPISPEPHNSSTTGSSPSNASQTAPSAGLKQYHFSGYDPKGYVSPSLLLKIYPSGKIDGLYTAKGRTLPNNNCAISSRVPLHGDLTGKVKPAARGIMDVGVQWCDTKSNIPPHTKAAPFSLWYDKKQGLIMEIENGYGGYKLFFNKPPINPFSEVEIPVPQPVSEITIAGTWKTNFGKMKLAQRGDTVTGSYTHDQGRLSGKFEGSILTGKWSEKPTYKPPYDAGDLRFVFSKNGKSFSGKWRYGYGGNGWKGDWTGDKISPKEGE